MDINRDTFRNQEYNLLKTLREQREGQSDLLDVKIIGDEGQELKAHWCVLLSCPFFESMYSSGLTEKQTGIVELKCLTFPAVRQAVDFLYDGSSDLSKLTLSELENLLEVADFMQIKILRQECIQQISQEVLNNDNCIRLWVLSYLYDYESSLKTRIEVFVYENLRDLLKKKTILEIPKDLVKSLLSSNKSSRISRDEMTEFVIDWTRFFFHPRKCYLNELLPLVKINKLTYSMLKKLKRICESVGDNEKCLLKCKTELRSRKRKVELGDWEALNPEVILLSDGKYILYYNFDAHYWGKLCKLPVKGVDCSLVSAYNTELYVVTSFSFHEASVQFLYLYKYDLRTNIWAPRICFDFNCFGANRFDILNIFLIKGTVYLFGKMKNTSNNCKIMMVAWTEDKSYPQTEILTCHDDEEVQFSVFMDCEIVIYSCIPQVYHKKNNYGFSSLYRYNVDHKQLSVIVKEFLNPVKKIKLLSSGKDILLVNKFSTSGTLFEFDDKSETFRTEKYPRMIRQNQIPKCCIFVKGKIYKFISAADREMFIDNRKFVTVYNPRNLKVKQFCMSHETHKFRGSWWVRRSRVLAKFYPQDHAVSVCRLPWNISCCHIFCQHCEKKK